MDHLKSLIGYFFALFAVTFFLVSFVACIALIILLYGKIVLASCLISAFLGSIILTFWDWKTSRTKTRI